MKVASIVSKVQNLLRSIKYWLMPEFHVGCDDQGDYVEVNGERHYHEGSSIIKFKNGWTAEVKVTNGL